MNLKKLEKIKFYLDLALVITGVLIAVLTICSFYVSAKIDFQNKLNQSKLEVTIAESKERAESATKDANEAKYNSKILELDLQKQIELTALVQIEHLKLQKQVKPRGFNKEQADQIIAELRIIKKAVISITSGMGDGEGLLYATNLREVFEYAGWEINKVGTGLSIYTGYGVYVLYNDGNREIAEAIIETFNKFQIIMEPQDDYHSKEIQIFVGSKNEIA